MVGPAGTAVRGGRRASRQATDNNMFPRTSPPMPLREHGAVAVLKMTTDLFVMAFLFLLDYRIMTKLRPGSVTGASGFLGSHVGLELLNKGYHVRAYVLKLLSPLQFIPQPHIRLVLRAERKWLSSPKIAKSSATNSTRLKLRTQALTNALEGVDAVIHIAASLPERQPPEVILASAIEGTLNVIRQAEKAGIKHWYPVTKETALSGTSFDVYRAAKTLAEKELWAFNDAHPHLDITTLNPPFLCGPLAETFTLPTPNYYALSTDLYIYRLLSPSGKFPPNPRHADVRDVARGHVLALTSSPASVLGRKRIIASPHGLDMAGTVALIAERRPELRDRLTKETPPTFPYDRAPVDFDRVEQVLGMVKGDFYSFEETILDTVDCLIAVEKQWIAQGI
ncbi:hypothetical protein H0H81_003680 [Sphagnurus paluster]|uniref:NAD-dependent epimerase/dehydratase domain-containing protein n=1 Tax=Sphagnurus paluster TaxID=117069 RepID=A0A9P7FST1_9AGAR|nr:hypothetical protein H0H81_003680 [Sphagnurus paluster]